MRSSDEYKSILSRNAPKELEDFKEGVKKGIDVMKKINEENKKKFINAK